MILTELVMYAARSGDEIDLYEHSHDIISIIETGEDVAWQAAVERALPAFDTIHLEAFLAALGDSNLVMTSHTLLLDIARHMGSDDFGLAQAATLCLWACGLMPGMLIMKKSLLVRVMPHKDHIVAYLQFLLANSTKW